MGINKNLKMVAGFSPEKRNLAVQIFKKVLEKRFCVAFVNLLMARIMLILL